MKGSPSDVWLWMPVGLFVFIFALTLFMPSTGGLKTYIAYLAMLFGPMVAACEARDVHELSKHGIIFGRWRYAIYLLTTILPVFWLAYVWERRKLVN